MAIVSFFSLKFGTFWSQTHQHSNLACFLMRSHINQGTVQVKLLRSSCEKHYGLFISKREPYANYRELTNHKLCSAFHGQNSCYQITGEQQDMTSNHPCFLWFSFLSISLLSFVLCPPREKKNWPKGNSLPRSRFIFRGLVPDSCYFLVGRNTSPLKTDCVGGWLGRYFSVN